MKPTLIEDNQTLQQFCDKFINEPLLAIDTEFFRETTYYPHLGLIQIASPSDIICVDPLAFDARAELRRLFLNPDITKVLHSCSQDMEVLYQYFGELPAPVFDTQLAAAMLGYQDQIGYAKLVAEQYDVELDKSQTRTNWLKRPLSAKQIEYAGEDVLYLLPLYEKFSRDLEEQGRDAWLQEDCSQLCGNSEKFQPDLENCWQRVKEYFRLEGVQLAVCKSVAQWRELLAMKKDLNRRRVMADDLVIKIASAQVEPADLAGIDARLRHLGSDELKDLGEALAKGLNTPQADWPIVRQQWPSTEEKKLLKRLLGRVQDKAEALGVHSSVLCSRKEVEKLMYGARSGRLIDGWRFELIGRALLAELE